MHFRTIVTLAFAAVGLAVPVKLNKDGLATSETRNNALTPAGEVHIDRAVDADTDTTADWQKVLAEHKRKRQDSGPQPHASFCSSSFSSKARNLDKADAGSFDDGNSAAPHDPVAGSGPKGCGAPPTTPPASAGAGPGGNGSYKALSRKAKMWMRMLN